jgi:hypothetical protein
MALRLPSRQRAVAAGSSHVAALAGVAANTRPGLPMAWHRRRVMQHQLWAQLAPWQHCGRLVAVQAASAPGARGVERVEVDDDLEGRRITEREQARDKARGLRRTVFNHERWVAHRSTSRYLRHLKVCAVGGGDTPRRG